MTTRHFAAALIFGVVLIVAVCLAPARGTTSRGYEAVSQSEFRSLVPPLRVGVEPTPSARSLVSPIAPPRRLGQSTPGPSPARTAVAPRPSPRPTRAPVGGIGDTAGALKGQATWYNDGPGLYGAAGPKLRALLGPGYLHRYVRVCSRGVCVVVRLITSCWCVPNTRLVDLSPEAFSRLAPLGAGVISVEVEF